MKYDSRVYWNDPNNLGGAAAGVGAAALGGFTNPLTDFTAALGIGQSIGGLLGLSKVPDYQSEPIDPAVTNMLQESQRMAKQGFSPEAIAEFHNATIQKDTARFRNATDRAGGSLAGAVNAGIKANDTSVDNAFASKDAALKAANQHYSDNIVKYYQGLKDKSWMNDENHRKALSMSFGGALEKGLGLTSGALMAGAAGFQGGKNNTDTTGLGENISGLGTQKALDGGDLFAAPTLGTRSTIGDLPESTWSYKPNVYNEQGGIGNGTPGFGNF